MTQSELLWPSGTAPTALNPRRSSNFCLVGSHKITLASLGHAKFPLDKVITLKRAVFGFLWQDCFNTVYFAKLANASLFMYVDNSGSLGDTL